MSIHRVLSAGALLLLPHCGARSELLVSEAAVAAPASPTSDSNEIPVPERCVSDWETLTEFESAKPSVALALAQGEVFFPWSNKAGEGVELRAVAEGGGESRVLASVADCDELWVEGERILCWATNKLFSLPLRGGSPELVLDAQSPSTPNVNGSLLVQAGELFWTQRTGGTATGVWRQARNGGARTAVGLLLDGEVTPYELAVGGNAVIAAGLGAAALPLGGGSPRRLAVLDETDFVGVDTQGAYYRPRIEPGAGGGMANVYEILRSPPDGAAPTTFWRGRPGAFISYLWETGDAWLATGDYYLGDGALHPVVVKLDAAGGEVLLACGPVGSRITGRPILSGGALYLITANPRATYRVHRIVLDATKEASGSLHGTLL